MRSATITQAKSQLSALLDEVRAGNSIVILDRGVPIATLEPIHAQPDAAGRLQRLARAGIVRPAAGPIPLRLLAQRAAPRTADGASAVAALLEERRHGR